jgi:hypothetical protein
MSCQVGTSFNSRGFRVITPGLTVCVEIMLESTSCGCGNIGAIYIVLSTLTGGMSTKSHLPWGPHSGASGFGIHSALLVSMSPGAG